MLASSIFVCFWDFPAVVLFLNLCTFLKSITRREHAFSWGKYFTNMLFRGENIPPLCHGGSGSREVKRSHKQHPPFETHHACGQQYRWKCGQDVQRWAHIRHIGQKITFQALRCRTGYNNTLQDKSGQKRQRENLARDGQKRCSNYVVVLIKRHVDSPLVSPLSSSSSPLLSIFRVIFTTWALR